jgi:transposase
VTSIIKKTIRGKPYYYARECKRVDGKPKIVWQKYLGTPAQIIQALTQPTAVPSSAKPQEAIITEFGAVVALYDLAKRLKITEFIDTQLPKASNGPTVGTYLLVAAINRCVAPCSKASIADWFKDTALRRLVDVQTRQLTSQRFWDNMDRVSSDDIAQIEEKLVTHMVKAFDIDLSKVLFDGTNFFTFIDTFNERCTVAQRGKNKEGRRALRIVGLSLLVSADFHVPLLHKTYPGNQADSPTFASLTSRLVGRYNAIVDGVKDITIVFDKGNNSRDNLDAVENSPYHFIGSLVTTHHKELLEISDDCFDSLEDQGLPGVRAYRTQKEVFGKKRTIVVTYNDNLFISQARTILREVGKRQQRLKLLQTSLRRRRDGKVKGGKPPTVEGTKKKVDVMLKAQHMKTLFSVKITEKDKLPHLTYRFDNRAWEKLQLTLLGKTILFTDNDHWANVEIIRGYRSQYHVEEAFRTMKDPYHICLRPQHHWTDQKIEVHVFYSVLALMLCSLLQRELHQKGIDHSIPALLDELEKIREVGVVYPPQGKKKTPRIEMTVSQMSSTQRTIYDALNLKQYIST